MAFVNKLTVDIQIDIYKKYYKYVLEEITKQKRENDKYLINSWNMINNENNNENHLINPEDYLEVGYMNSIIRGCRLPNYTENDKKNIFGTIERVLLHYYSLKYDERRTFHKEVFKNNDEINFTTVISYIEYITSINQYNLIDPDDVHTGATGSYCISTGLCFIINKDNTKKLEDWVKLVNTYCKINT